MARADKVAAVEEIREGLTGAGATLLTEYRGLTVAELAELRTELRKVDATYRVFKNTLARRAANEAGFDGLDDLLVGPTALVFCGEDPVGPAKALKAFAKDHDELIVKGGYLDGKVLDADETMQLAEMESLEDILSGIAGLVEAAVATPARLAGAAGQNIAQLVGALEAKGGAQAEAA